jgi:sulfatase maturation enzyme AslB (radical SAM superfamily)
MSTDLAVLNNPLSSTIRSDIPGRFSELDVLKRQWPRIANMLRGNILPPYEVLIHPSSACNLCCVWCIGDHVPIEAKTTRGQLKLLDASKSNPQRLPDNLADPSQMLRLINGISSYRKEGTYFIDEVMVRKEFKVEAVSFSGLIGEPLVSKQAVLLAMELLVENDIRTGIFTNGVLMDESTLDTIVKISYVHLSLDAGNGETYGALKFGGRSNGKAQFDKALRNLRNLVTRRENTSTSKLELNASFILYPENYREVFTAAEILKDTGVENLRVKRDISGQRLLNREQKLEAIDLLKRIQTELVDERFKLIEIHKLDGSDETSRSFPTCFITEIMGAIGSDGHLYPCNYHPRPGGATYGSAIDVPFAQVWEGAKREVVKKGLPHICPAMCDPFKNRANKLLNVVNDIYQNEGMAQLEFYKNELPTR